jgi:hypothetical protein
VAADQDDSEPADAAAPRPGPRETQGPREVPRLRDQPPPDEPEAPPETAPDLRERQLAEHVRYRQVVEVAVQASAARDTWDRAAPELRTEWEAHKQRYPAPERQPASTQPDGSWLGDGGRRLSPEQNAEAGKCAADLSDEARQSIRPAMERIEAADPGRRLAGLEHMLKGDDRLKEKVADELRAQPELTVKQAMCSVPDPVRFTLCYPSQRYADGVAADVDRLKSEGFELVKLKNLWQSDQYKGINSQWRAPDTGTRVEMQFHTAESLEAKELTHEAYERVRSRAIDPTERQELQAFQRRANMSLATPPGTAEIADLPRPTEKNDA